MQNKSFIKPIILTLSINLVFIIHSFSQLLINDNVTISNSAQITVKGNIENKPGTIILNDGTIDMSGDWINNSGNSGFGNSAGTVILNGINQTISGVSSTTFNNLTLQGAGTKTLQQNISVGGSYVSPTGVLNVGNSILDLNSNTMSVVNSSSNAITSGSGFILSEAVDNSSKITWSINVTNGAHILPFGNSLSEKIPLTFNLTSGDAGDVTFSTYATAPDNTPLPVTPILVTHVRNSAGLDNSANTVDRFWQIDKTGASCNAALTFTYGNPEIAANGNVGMVAQKWNPISVAWDVPIPGQLNPLTNTVIVTNVSGFGTWAVATGLSPLPVTLLIYDVKAIDNNKVRNTWSTASETNNDFFTIERSKDGLNFTAVGTVKGAGSSNHINNYLFDDLKPYPGISYYRIKQTDLNSNFTISEIKSINLKNNNPVDVELYPNPVQSILNINIAANNFTTIILDATGRKVFESADNRHLDLQNLAPGVYTISVSAGETTYKEKFMKQ